jgi:hypothetical protein
VLSAEHWEVLSSKLEYEERMRNAKCGMRNGLARNAEREVLSENPKLRTQNSELRTQNIRVKITSSRGGETRDDAGWLENQLRYWL